MFAPLKALLGLTITQGHLIVRDAAGVQHVFGDGSGPRIAIAFKDRRFEWAMVRDPELMTGEGYMQGRLVMEEGSIYDFIELSMRNMAAHPLPAWAQGFANLRKLTRRWQERNNLRRAKNNVHHHYDIDQDIYDLFLDRQRQYSCAYFAPGVTQLEDAQAAKMRHIAAKLRLDKGQRILDIGCGWGGLARYLAAMSEGEVRGITLSASQLRGARTGQRPERGSCEFTCEDYRTVSGIYDRIVSVGMFEHVGTANYVTFFSRIKELLARDGIALVHAIGRLDGPAPTNPFVARWIFPGGSLAALSQITTAIETSGLLMTDIEILRLHYAETLRQWRVRFLSKAAEAERIAGPEFVRMWEFYLAGCEAAFRHQFLMVFQIQLAKTIDTVPITRDYMVEAERRLAHGPAVALRTAGPRRPGQREVS